MSEDIKKQSISTINEIIEKANLKSGDILVIGCSSSEVCGNTIGHGSSPDVANVIVSAILPIIKEKGIMIAAQCCEHLNRALIVEKQTAKLVGSEIVNVRPVPKAGGSFAAAVWNSLSEPVAIEEIKADAGLDIGLTLIGMHLKRVAVPLRLENCKIGSAVVTAAYTRPKYIGGERAQYI